MFGTLRMLVRPAMKRLFCLKAKNGLGRFAPSALPHYHATGTTIPVVPRYQPVIPVTHGAIR